MKKSSLVASGLASVVAVLMTGCSTYTQTQTADCVDAQGHVVPDSYCQNNNTYYSGYTGYHHWIYGGSVSTYGGTRTVMGGSSTPMDGATVVSRSGSMISHGGFGGAGDGHGGGGDGHGG